MVVSSIQSNAFWFYGRVRNPYARASFPSVEGVTRSSETHPRRFFSSAIGVPKGWGTPYPRTSFARIRGVTKGCGPYPRTFLAPVRGVTKRTPSFFFAPVRGVTKGYATFFCQ